MTSATQRFASIPELTGCLARIIVSRQLLMSLCLTSKNFNAVFTPALYEEIIFQPSNVRFLLELQQLVENKALKYTRVLDITITENGLRQLGLDIDEESISSSVQKLLPNMPNLVTFSWREILLHKATISKLYHECPRLRSLVIHLEFCVEDGLWSDMRILDDFDSHKGFDEKRNRFITRDLLPFSNLIHLELHRIYGDLTRERGDIVALLTKSPALESLGLSISYETTERLHSESSALSSEKYMNFLNFFGLLCIDYRSSGSKPLKLRKLHLGYGIILSKPGQYLPYLTELAYLEDLYVSNDDNVEITQHLAEKDYIEWNTLTPTMCSSITTFGVSRLDEQAVLWVQNLPQGQLRQLITEFSVKDELLQTAVEQLSHHTGLLADSRLLTFNAHTIGDFRHVRLDGIQALYIGLTSYSEVHQRVLKWASEAPDLQQLYLEDYHAINVLHKQQFKLSVNSLAHRIACDFKKLEFLKLHNSAWRIRRSPINRKDWSVRLEKLDRFESRSIELFRPQRWIAWGA